MAQQNVTKNSYYICKSFHI